jgi:DNA-binding IscR family transcriptional regulator
MSWTFLSNHGHVAVQLAKNPDIKVAELAKLIGVTERHISSVLNDLREAGYLEITKEGRKNKYRLLIDMPLRHNAESYKTLQDLLNVFGDE